MINFISHVFAKFPNSSYCSNLSMSENLSCFSKVEIVLFVFISLDKKNEDTVKRQVIIITTVETQT